MSIHVRAPATTANLGPGFDIAGAALDLWNELELGEPNGTVDESHLGVRAFARRLKPGADTIPRGSTRNDSESGRSQHSELRAAQSKRFPFPWRLAVESQASRN